MWFGRWAQYELHQHNTQHNTGVMLCGKLRCYALLGLTVSPIKTPLNFRLHRGHSEHRSTSRSALFLINDGKPLEVFYILSKDRENLLFNSINKLKIIMNIISYIVTFFILTNQVNLEKSHDFARDRFRGRNVSDSFFKFLLHR